MFRYVFSVHIQPVKKVFTAKTVPVFVFVTVRRVETQTGCVLVLLDGWVLIVLQVYNFILQFFTGLINRLMLKQIHAPSY